MWAGSLPVYIMTLGREEFGMVPVLQLVLNLSRFRLFATVHTKVTGVAGVIVYFAGIERDDFRQRLKQRRCF